MAQTKLCRRCQTEKPVSEFYKDSKNKTDGLASYCKACKRQRWREWYHEGGKVAVDRYKQSERGREVHRQANRRYDQTEQGRAAARRKWLSEATKEHNRRYRKTAQGKRINRQIQRKWRQDHPEQKQAHNKVLTAIRNGSLLLATDQTCIDCGGQAEHYHHEDYSRPLDVTPLCPDCHRARHN